MRKFLDALTDATSGTINSMAIRRSKDFRVRRLDGWDEWSGYPKSHGFFVGCQLERLKVCVLSVDHFKVKVRKFLGEKKFN